MSTAAGLPIVGTTAALDEAFSGLKTHGEGAGEGRSADSGGYRVNIPTFEGPLDLLLHLIRREQMNIYDIPIAQICSSYLEYLEILHQPDVNLAGEFMVMASTLMFIKSEMLLPREKTEEEDPRQPLVAMLLEYERYQRASKVLDARGWLGRDVFARPEGATKDSMPTEALLDAPVEGVESFSLLVALKVALDRSTRPPILIAVDTTSLKDMVGTMTHDLESHEVVELKSFWPNNPKRTEIIIAFIAMLELARLKFIEIIQPEILGPIQIRRVRSFEELNVSLLQQF